MAKTITIRVDDNIYELIKKAADGELRTLSNFIEYATMVYLTNNMYVSDSEMEEVMNDTELIESLRSGLEEVKKGKYSIVK